MGENSILKEKSFQKKFVDYFTYFTTGFTLLTLLFLGVLVWEILFSEELLLGENKFLTIFVYSNIFILLFVWVSLIIMRQKVVLPVQKELSEMYSLLDSNINEQKQTRAELVYKSDKLLREQAKIEAIINSMGSGVIASSRDGNIFLLNQEAEHILGFEQDELLGKFIKQILYPDQCKDDRKLCAGEGVPIEKALQGEKASQVVFFQNRKGDRMELEDIATPIKVNEYIVGVVDIIRDVTKERQVERAQKEFVSIASHQLRTPLTTINWHAEILMSEKGLNKDQRMSVREIFDQGQRMKELVTALLNLSRIDLGTLKFIFEDIDINEVVASIKDSLELNIKDKEVILETISSIDTQLRQDEVLLRVVLENLISNAVKYSQKGGVIKVCMEYANKSKTEVLIKVQDSGLGIPKDQQAQIFTRLFRAENARQRETDGNGLGLYITKKIVEAMKGKIWFESEEGKGTIFFLKVPVDLEKTFDLST
jgi:PAS domain S-box-containing protein